MTGNTAIPQCPSTLGAVMVRSDTFEQLLATRGLTMSHFSDRLSDTLRSACVEADTTDMVLFSEHDGHELSTFVYSTSMSIGDVTIVLELSTTNAAIETPTQNIERAMRIATRVLKDAAYLLNDPFGDKAQATQQRRRELIDEIMEHVGDTGVPRSCYEVSLSTLTTDQLRKIADNPQRFIDDVTQSSGNGQRRVREALRNLRRPRTRR